MDYIGGGGVLTVTVMIKIKIDKSWIAGSRNTIVSMVYLMMLTLRLILCIIMHV